MPNEDYEKAANDFIGSVVSSLRAETELSRLLDQTPNGTLGDWKESDSEAYEKAVALADNVDFEWPDDETTHVDEVRDAWMTQLFETSGYGADVMKVVTVTLAGGGPAGWLSFRLGSDGELVSAEVSYCDWFQAPYSRELSHGDAMAAYDRYGIDLIVSDT